MGLRERLQKQSGESSQSDVEHRRFEKFGVIDNPFPSASQTQGHPRLETEADDEIEKYVREYDQNGSSQVLVITGTQGTGKTNLLNYYEQEFKKLYSESEGYYIIRYLADPEPGFDKLLARILQQELGSDFFKKIGKNISKLSDVERNNKLETIRSSDLRIVLYQLGNHASKSAGIFDDTANAALEWILGFRLYKRHREVLGQIQFRLDTVESKTQVFRDLVYFCADLGVLKGLILLLDELEKLDDTTSKITVLRFLSALRAMIDALPKYLFLMTAVTPVTLSRYFTMLPAFAGRLQNRIKLPYLNDITAATNLHNFYLDNAKQRAAQSFNNTLQNIQPLIPDNRFKEVFDTLLKNARDHGDEGIRQRDFLNELHLLAESEFSKIL